MRFAVFHLIMALWVLWRFVLPLRMARGAKWALALVIVAISLFSTVTTLFFGGLLSPELPKAVLIAGNFGEAVLLFLTVFTLLREVVIFFSVLAGRSGEKLHQAVQQDKRAAIGLGALSVGLAAFGIKRALKCRKCAGTRQKFLIFRQSSRASNSFSFQILTARRF